MRNILKIFLACAVAAFGCTTKNNQETTTAAGAQPGIDSLVKAASEEVYNNPGKADTLAKEILLVSQKQNYDKGVAQAWFLMSSVQQQLGQYDSALVLTTKALDIYTQLGDKTGQARCYNDIGICYDFKASYSKAIDNYLKALTLFDELKDTRGQVNAYNNIGIIHQNQSNFLEAHKYYLKALAIAQETRNGDGESTVLNSIGSNYTDQGNYDSALKYFTLLLEQDLKSGNKSYISYSYNNVGEAYLGLADYDVALEYFEKSRKLKEELGNRRALANTLENIAEVNMHRKEYGKAQALLLEAVAISQELDLPEYLKEGYNLLHRLHLQKGEYKQALDYYKLAAGVRTGINYDKKMAEISQLEKEYSEEKSRRTIEEAGHKAEKNRLLALVYVFIITLLLVFSVSLWFGLRQKQKNNKALMQYQQQLEQKNKQLEDKNKQVEEALAVRSRFLSFMSHEIRTPLNGITGLVGLLRDQPYLPEQEEFIDALKRSADNLVLLLTNVLDMSKLEMGKIVTENIELNLRKIIADLVLLYKANAGLRNNSIDIDIDAAIPEKLQGDPYRITQILSNLVGNAIKFTKDGRIIIRCSVAGSTDGKYDLLFEIIDTGIGIAPEQLENIMEPFSQAESYTTRQYGGTGLGLSISSGLIGVMGSRLNVQSKLGEGSRFYFTLTLTEYKPPVFNPGQLPPTLSDTSIEGKTILVVEDNTTNILLFTRLLATWKTVYDVAVDGAKAIEFAKNRRYDIILMDLHLPGITGYATAQKIKKEESLNNSTPILAITAADAQEVATHPLRQYLDDVLYKPVKYEELYRKLKSMIKV